MTRLPERLWRVVFDQGFGYPVPYKRERTQRTYSSAEAAARQVAILAEWPRHHRLVGVYTTATAWEEVDPATLPVPSPPDEEQPC